MTVRTTLSFTDRHHGFLIRKVEEGEFASTSAAVASAVEQMIKDEIARETGLTAMAGEIRARMNTPLDDYIGHEDAFADARVRVATGRAASKGR